jgi:hypothetical protein
MTQLRARIPDRDHLSMRRGVIRRRHFITTLPDHHPIPDDHAPERPTPPLFHPLTCQLDRLPQKHFVHFCIHVTNLLACEKKSTIFLIEIPKTPS